VADPDPALGWHELDPEPSPNQGTGWNLLTGVSGRTASNAWAVGDYNDGGVTRTLILHWNGSAWTPDTQRGPQRRRQLPRRRHAVSGTDVWAVGSYTFGPFGNDANLIEHFDGTSWTQVFAPSRDPSSRLVG